MMDLELQQANTSPKHEKYSLKTKLNFFLLSFKTLGVIYGDIGTSPLYVVTSIFAGVDSPTDSQIIGAISCIIYSLILLVTVKYVIFILMADAQGEGGTFALLSLLIGKDKDVNSARKYFAVFVTLIAASLVIGDGVLTPSISVLSAIEGLNTYATGMSSWVIVITIVIMLFLFIGQRFGTSKIAVTFSPIMVIWFISLAIIGLYQIALNPRILAAFNPGAAVMFLVNSKADAFPRLGGVFLAVTGLEALYADLGHFGKGPIRLCWCAFVLPSLVLNYLGQGALVLRNAAAFENPFYLSVSDKLYWPLFVLATLATIIASQAMITGCFSLISQAISLNFCPPLAVLHTSTKIIGQIYVPVVNYLLLILTIVVIGGFRSSAKISEAYGVTVCTVMIATTVLYTIVMRTRFAWSWFKVVPFMAFFLPLDLFFWMSNLTKLATYGWVSIIFAVFFSSFMVAWTYGEKQLKKFNKSQLSVSFDELIHSLAKPHEQSSKHQFSIDEVKNKYPGIGVYYCYSQQKAPQSFLKLTHQLHTVPETLVFLKIDVVNEPFVPDDKRVTVVTEEDVHFVTIKFGFVERETKLLERLRQIPALEHLSEANTTIFTENYHIHEKQSNIFHRAIIAFYSLLKRSFRSRLHMSGFDDLMIEVGIRAIL